MQHLAAVLRYSSSSWAVQSDAGHAPIGVTGVQPVTTGYGKRLRVSFCSGITKVGAAILQPDNVLAQYGFLAVGGEVGTTAADFQLLRQANIRGGVGWNGSAWEVGYMDSAFPVTAMGMGGGVVRIFHTPLADALMPPSVTWRDPFYPPRVGLFASNYFDIKFPVGVEDTNCVCLFHRQGLDVVDPYSGYENSDGNFWLHGVAHT